MVAQRQRFEVLHFSERGRCQVAVAERRIVWTHAPYRTIFQNTKVPKKTSTEYLVECGSDLVRIECKWQATSGSVDEKYPYMFLNAALTMTEPTIVFALGGEYFESARGGEVREWLRNVCSTPPDWFSAEVRMQLQRRELLVLTVNTFERWFRERFPIPNGLNQARPVRR